MSFESFYGGRQGASFIIVERFDGIDIPEDPGSYRSDFLAVTADGQSYIYENGHFIFRNEHNYYFCYEEVYFPTPLPTPKPDPHALGLYEFNGVTYILTEDTEPVTGKQYYKKLDSYTWKRTLLDGRSVPVQGSAQPQSLPIEPARGMVQCFKKGGDTTNIVNYGEYVIIDTPNKSHPDNGKVYRRGMNYKYDVNTNPLAGAEYIGQIVGPQGEASEIDIDKYDIIDEITGRHTGTYTMPDDDLVPGKYVENNVVKYNDDIKYAYVTIRDEFGNITGSLIGFKIPYCVIDLLTAFRTPYYEEGDVIPPGKEIGDRLPEDFNLAERLNDETHPFYEQWKIHLPHGIKGESITLLETYEVVGVGTKIYSDQACTQDETITVSDLAIVETLSEPDAYKVELPDDTFKYAKIDNKVRLRIRHDLIDYDNNRDGDRTLVDIGKYNYISDVNVGNDGTLTVTYTYDDSDVFEKKIKWISSVNVNENGTVTFTYNTGATETTETAIQWLTNIRINTHGDQPNGKEGDGDQKVYITYNTDEEGIEHAIGEPLNYVLDTYIVPLLWDERVLPEEAWRAYKGHLLVYYSDPTRRSDTTTGIGQYLFPSARLDTSVKGWVDLGDVKGETKTPLSIGYVDSFSDLENAGPPEEIMQNNKYAGWGVTYTSGGTEWVAQYDYLAEEWTRGIAYGSGISDPSQVIATETTNLWNNGFHVQVVSRKSVE